MEMDATPTSHDRNPCPSLYAHAGIPTQWSTIRAPSSNPSPPASIRATPQQLRPIRLRLLRSRTINVTLMTGRRGLPAASLIHDQTFPNVRTSMPSKDIAATTPTAASASSSKHQSTAARQYTADTTIDAYHHHHVASHSSFPSLSSSFVPPPMPAKHEYAEVKRASAPPLNGAERKKTEDIDVGVSAKAMAEAATTGLAAAETAAPPTTPTSSFILMHALARSHSHVEGPATPTPHPAPTPNASPLRPQTSIPRYPLSLPPPPPLPQNTHLSSKRHSQLSQSHQSPANSRRASTLSTASNTSVSSTNTTTANLFRSSTCRLSKRSSRPSTPHQPRKSA
ncbi:hypothetical protein M422DRAFT_268241 [Sphaerobolus stellatus SS14]|uniref:Uncharacterized protein n=1 Tax=Sphaerobolus stellatus (strain SS14) TaxID=990650 RepID=A0A0C9UY10_SPHS4|nr:hypothetical protein M422DRAFT_268241 [Sphaerobolus stellatus SS14]